MPWILKKILSALVLPPAGPLLLAVVGLLLVRRRPRLGKSLAWTGFIALWLLSTPAVTKPMLASIEDVLPLDIARAKGAQAIVVLGGGSYRAAPEYGGDTVSRWSLERIRYAARLQRETGLPLLVSGGAPLGGVAEGRSMRAALEREFGAKVRWVEDASADTRENARLSAPMLREAGVRRILLVTHAWHMQRALGEFAAAGLEIVAAPTGYETGAPPTPLDWLPGPGGLWAGRIALNERLGRLVQRITPP
ncbi:MAG: YdcF family protein [Zoogloeaceae bacterium]|nr:YdcF family protein [Zoogloeaceae bacterium]MCK6384007.1 YdcF family protein [Rhodocyclaceae bacterium]